MKNLFIMYKFTIYKSSEFINKFIYKSNYNDLKSRLIKQKYYNLNNKIQINLICIAYPSSLNVKLFLVLLIIFQ